RAFGFGFTDASMRDGAAARKGVESLRAESLSGQRTIATNKVSRGTSLLALQLHLEQFECDVLAASHKKMIALHSQFGGRQCLIDRLRLPYLQLLTAKFRIRARPRLKTAQTIPYVSRGQGKIDETIFFLENGSESGPGVILRTGMN